eukprot:jgi/Mesen1/1641/ME000135S00637
MGTQEPVTLRVAGQWCGQIQVPSLKEWKLKDLYESIAHSSGFDAKSLKIICGGRTLKEHEGAGAGASLEELGVAPTSKLLLMRTAPSLSQAFLAQEERHNRLSRLKAAADAMVKRSGDDPFSGRAYDMQLENQSGQALRFDCEEDRSCCSVTGPMVGLCGSSGMPTTAGAAVSLSYDVAPPRPVLRHFLHYYFYCYTAGYEAFSLCSKDHLQAVDNVAMLQLDIVWAHFLLRDVASLARARERLRLAREGLRRAHGPHLERLRLLQGRFSPELATYLRIELLEGVAAFHAGHLDAARASLLAAQSLYQRLQVADDELVQLAAMGFGAREAKRALRMAGHDAQQAVSFLMDQRQRAAEKEQADARRRAQRRCRPPSPPTEDLVLSRVIAATSSKKARKRRRASVAHLAHLLSMGYSHPRAVRALEEADNDLAQALEQLLGGAYNELERPPGGRADAGANASTSANASDPAAESGDSLQEAAAAGDERGLHSAAAEETEAAEEEEPVDEEMEADIAQDVSGDPLAQYDVDVEREGEAIREYLALLEAAATAG